MFWIGSTVVACVMSTLGPVQKPLIGAHYFGGWYTCQGATNCDSHFKGYTPLGVAVDDWRPYYPNRIPLLGNLSVSEDTIVNEIKTADKALDFFDVLYYDGGSGPSNGKLECDNSDANLAHCLDTALAWMLNSTKAWVGVQRLHFFISYSNDIDRGEQEGMFVGDTGETKWLSFVDTWVRAMKHPRYLRINNKPLFKILIPDIFVTWQCANNATLANMRIAQLKEAAIAQGLPSPQVGGGWQNPSIPNIPQQTPRPHPEGYMEYPGTTVLCPGGVNDTTCDIGSPKTVSSLAMCQSLCNTTENCQAFIITRGANDTGSFQCILKTIAGPGSPNSTITTYVRVPGTVSYDWSGTYNAAPPVCPGQPNWQCEKYRNSWYPNATKNGAKVFPYTEMAQYQANARGNHSNDSVPYLASLIAGFDPRPWQEHAPSFTDPTQQEWNTYLLQVKSVLTNPQNRFGFPDESAPNGVYPAVNIYAWNEFGEGGILAPSQGDGFMKINTVASVFA
eukprot:m.7068 g.7068  ORF g.7068 m.7068 type:complete len:505 (-) comp3643_c0_seq1:164-1678(-)